MNTFELLTVIMTAISFCEFLFIMMEVNEIERLRDKLHNLKSRRKEEKTINLRISRID